MNDTAEIAARPIAVQLSATITALVYQEPESGGYSAKVPALRGCHTEGETLEEVRFNLREVIGGWLSSAHDSAVRGNMP